MNAITAELARQQEAGQFAVQNPATQEIIGTLPNMAANQIAEAVARAAAAQVRWAATPVRDRMRILARFAELLCEQKDFVAAIISREAGKPEAEAHVYGSNGCAGHGEVSPEPCAGIPKS